MHPFAKNLLMPAEKNKLPKEIQRLEDFFVYARKEGKLKTFPKVSPASPFQSIFKELSVFVDQYKKEKKYTCDLEIHIEKLLNRQKDLDSLNEFLFKVIEHTEVFLEEGINKKNTQKFLKIFGDYLGVSRVYIFQNNIEKKGVIHTSQIHEWVAKGIESQMDKDFVNNIPYKDLHLESWIRILGKGKVISSHVKNFTKKERSVFEAQDILSILAMPIMVENHWWGFIGFDQCDRERVWSVEEKKILRLLIQVYSLFLEKTLFEEKFYQKMEKLERINKLMIGRELRMIELKEKLKSKKKL